MRRVTHPKPLQLCMSYYVRSASLDEIAERPTDFVVVAVHREPIEVGARREDFRRVERRTLKVVLVDVEGLES